MKIKLQVILVSKMRDTKRPAKWTVVSIGSGASKYGKRSAITSKIIKNYKINFG